MCLCNNFNRRDCMNVASAVMPRKDSTGRCFWSSCGKAAVGPLYSTPPPGRLLRKAFQVHHSSQRSSLIADPEADRFIYASWCHTESICRMADVGFAATSVPPTPQHSLSYPLNDQPWATVHSSSRRFMGVEQSADCSSIPFRLCPY